MIRRGLILLPLLACLACAQGSSRSGTQSLDPSFLTAGGSWSDGATIWVMAKAVPMGEALGVCGAWTVQKQSAQTLNLHDEIIQSALLRFEGDTLIQNLTFMQELSYAPDLKGKQANCVVTRASWRDGAEALLSIRIPRRSFGGGLRRDSEPRVTFRQELVPSLLE